MLRNIHSIEEVQLSLEDSQNPSRMANLGEKSSADRSAQSTVDGAHKDQSTEGKITPPPPSDQTKSHHVLVVEDVLSSQKMRMRLLQRANCTCVAASNGQEAVDAIRATLAAEGGDVERGIPESFDTIRMDFEMPVLNGPDVTEIIRAMGYTGLILGVTGNLAEDVHFFVSKGANHSVVPKPVSMAVLKDVWLNPNSHGHGPNRRASHHMLRKLSSSQASEMDYIAEALKL
jgi:CheY-like chemotaxis protein